MVRILKNLQVSRIGGSTGSGIADEDSLGLPELPKAKLLFVFFDSGLRFIFYLFRLMESNRIFRTERYFVWSAFVFLQCYV